MIVCCPSCQRSYVVSDEQIAGKQFRARCKSCGVEFRLDGTQSPDASAVSDKNEPAKFMSATEAFLALQSAPPPAASAWSVALSKTDTRRMTIEEAAQAYTKGTFGTDVLVRKSGMQKWVRFSEVPELMAVIGKPLSKTPGKSAGAADKTSFAPSSEPPTRPGTSVLPGKGPKPTGPVRSGTLMDTGASLVPRPSVSPSKASSTQPPPRPDDLLAARSRAKPELNEKGKDEASPKAGPATLRPRSKPSTAPRPASESPASKPPLKRPQFAHEDDSDTSKREASQGKSAIQGSPATAPEHGTAPEAAPPIAADRELEIVVEIDEPQAGAMVGAAGSGGVVLPPLKGAEAQPAVAGAIAAASSLAGAPPKHDRVEAKDGEGQHGRDTANASTDTKAQPDASASSEVTGGPRVEEKVGARPLKPGDPASRPGNSSSNQGDPAGEESVLDSKRDSHIPLRARKGSRFAGVVVGMGVVGVLGVLGGVAGAVYVMRGTANTIPSIPSVVALQPRPATPASAAGGDQAPATETAARAAASNSALASATDTESVGANVRHSVDSHRSSAPVKPAVAAAARAPVAKTPTPVADTQPATAATTPFNRESALAVLGFAASRAPTCKKPDGPKGSARVQVTFDPSGAAVAASVVGAPIAGTSTAQCVASIFRKVRVAPFAGDRVTIPKDFTIPP